MHACLPARPHARLPACPTEASLLGFPLTWRLCFRYVHVPNPAFDYVAPELISLFVTDTGGYTPSYVYRLLAEYYSSQDWMLDDMHTYQ